LFGVEPRKHEKKENIHIIQKMTVFNNIKKAAVVVVCEPDMSLVAGRFSSIQTNFTLTYSVTNNNPPMKKINFI
jgi:hypothetical protein